MLVRARLKALFFLSFVFFLSQINKTVVMPKMKAKSTCR